MDSPPQSTDPEAAAPLEQQLTIRKRRWAPRVRTGCWTCRSRHVKCDEVRPSCIRCRKGNRTCSGYLDSVAPTSLQLSSAPVESCLEELRLNRHFLHHVIPSATPKLSCDYWRYYIPRFTNTVPAIWHATNALSALMWTTIEANGDAAAVDCSRLGKLAVIQHSASIKQILQLTEKKALSMQDKTVILVANFFLCVVSGYPGNLANFMALHKKAVRLIRHWKFWECVDTSDEAMHLLFSTINHVRMHEDSLLVTPDTPSDDWQEALAYLQERPLKSVLKAYMELEMIWISLHAILEELLAQSSTTAVDVAVAHMKRASLQSRFLLWEEQYLSLIYSTKNISPLGSAALSVRRILTRICFEMRLEPFEHAGDETRWDPFDRDFTSAWCGIEETLTAGTSYNVDAPTRFGPSLRISLQFIARFCRKQDIRHAAAALLRSQVPKAMSIEPSTMPLLVESIIALEEGHWDSCCQVPKCRRGEFICNWHRVAKVNAISLEELRYHEFQCLTVGDIHSVPEHGKLGDVHDGDEARDIGAPSSETPKAYAAEQYGAHTSSRDVSLPQSACV
ncbi:C6 zinc finger domain protein [Beauveria brongniartii RCEF 3172]|uniref:C6 zinc finger domain protein n=1 Tax=Beauveria brongniartii RCEF 3172 TaxID=1081107 RepID=A0A166RTY4_9HYPO|nr:C6 zinc finger domain protein [Beauveria brongniartii RCEF 3172]